MPGKVGDVRNRIFIPAHVPAGGKIPIQYIELPFDFHRIAMDGVLELFGRVGVEVAEATPEIGCGAHLPE